MLRNKINPNGERLVYCELYNIAKGNLKDTNK